MNKMTTIKAILVDDEKNGRENLRGLLQQYCPEVSLLAEAQNALQAIDLIQEHQPDLVFLDIEMPGGNGFKVLEFFKEPQFSVIFVTAYDHYAIQAIRFSALDYILKPIDLLLLKSAVNRFVEQKSTEDKRLEQFLKNETRTKENKRIALPMTDMINYIEINCIIKCQGEANYTRFYLTGGKEYLVSKSLVEYEEILNGFGFFRTHKSFLVNVSHIVSFVKTDGGYLVMSDKSTVPVSRRKKELVLKEIQ
ncbi:LytR/AlgR family response regulator transcription factor [Mangrovibacterium diazotrophicum]|uniref:LytTR family two component transcriptional regulator n=1 Tax=Mangrovibacterium diazotrophicum TaxID=1261403 RepID=A0A419W893_9BACT|nr:LytTR family DNA-binding domain-containing protein [Mangrovibacterium diazotrophicum]RKD91665.1 LytTR family two component transcriptional regulator [Mangrovibacterium diazotrophicum]